MRQIVLANEPPENSPLPVRLDQPLLRLPVRFCAETLAEEVRALPPRAWVPHPQGFTGNEAVPLVSPGGRLTDDLAGPMAPTEFLLRSPYMMEAMAELDATWGRSRLMGLGAGAEVPSHVDINYYWRTHVRVHIPVITNPGVQFSCGGETVHMQAGECWVLDTFRRHQVRNTGREQRIHLVLDTVGGEHLWDLIEAARRGEEPAAAPLAPDGRSGAALKFEQRNSPRVMTPWEVRCHFHDLLQLCPESTKLGEVGRRLDRFQTGWAAAWARFGEADEGLPVYRGLIEGVRQELQSLGADDILLRNGRSLRLVLDAMVFANAIARPPVQQSIASATAQARLAS